MTVSGDSFRSRLAPRATKSGTKWSTVGWANRTAGARRLSSAPAVGVVAASLALTAVAYAPFAIAQLPARLPSAQVTLSVLVLGLVCTAVAFLLFFALIGEVGPARATIITYFNPAVALALGVVLLNEPFTAGIAIGFALIAAGSFVATRRGRGIRGAEATLPEAAP